MNKPIKVGDTVTMTKSWSEKCSKHVFANQSGEVLKIENKYKSLGPLARVYWPRLVRADWICMKNLEISE